MTFTEPTPTTPEHSNGAAGSGYSGSLPPRSSSRTTHPDFVGNKHSPTSPLGNKEIVPKEFTDRQNRLGSLRGHATSQIDLKDPVAKRDSTRNSVARESNKSQASMTKGMLHNIHSPAALRARYPTPEPSPRPSGVPMRRSRTSRRRAARGSRRARTPLNCRERLLAGRSTPILRPGRPIGQVRRWA